LTPPASRASFEEIRKHVLDDAVELVRITGLVAPMVDTSLDPDTTFFFLRSVLFRSATLTVCRLHDPPCWKGQTGATASIEALLNIASSDNRLLPSEARDFDARREALKVKLTNDGVSYEEDLIAFPNAELAHSLHRHSPAEPLMFRPIWNFAHDTFELVIDIEKRMKETPPDLTVSFTLGEIEASVFGSVMPKQSEAPASFITDGGWGFLILWPRPKEDLSSVSAQPKRTVTRQNNLATQPDRMCKPCHDKAKEVHTACPPDNQPPINQPRRYATALKAGAPFSRSTPARANPSIEVLSARQGRSRRRGSNSPLAG
jgi:hypothetical protein